MEENSLSIVEASPQVVSPSMAVDSLAVIEALPLDAPEAAAEFMVLPDKSLPALPEVVELSGLEFGLLDFSQDTPALDTNLVANVVNPPVSIDSLEFVGLDTALQKLANGEGDSIEPLLDSIVRRLLPLLEFYSDRREGVLASGIADIKTRCLEQG